MNLWVSSLLLFAGFVLSVSALTEEECKPLITPQALDDRSKVFGKTYFLMGYTNSDAFNDIMKLLDSSWMNVTASDAGDHEVVMYEENKINGTCFASKVKMVIDTETRSVTASMGNMTSVFQTLPGCDGCLILSANTTARNFDKFLKAVNIQSDTGEEEFSVKSLYLMARESQVSDADVEHFKKQASCLGFEGEPTFVYDPKNEMCKEGEGILMAEL